MGMRYKMVSIDGERQRYPGPGARVRDTPDMRRPAPEQAGERWRRPQHNTPGRLTRLGRARMADGERFTVRAWDKQRERMDGERMRRWKGSERARRRP